MDERRLEGRMAGLGEGTVERVFVVTAIALWLLLSGCASEPPGDSSVPDESAASTEVDGLRVAAGAFDSDA